ncbi:MAG: glutaminyl-peptide cyclotransferase [Alistipes sp.]|nr:glutaminyl-peptide cyclotransferase [Alistipes sp.]
MKHFVTILIALTALVACGGAQKRNTSSQSQNSASRLVEPQFYTYQVVAEHPHLRTSYTQGLQFVDGELWEGTGEYGHSRILRTDLASGKALQSRANAHNEFGEGITVLGNKIYQLTWLNGRLHTYDRKTLEHLDTHTYKGEGWGLTSDGEKLYMSDGTHSIRILNPATLKQERRFSVTMRGESLQNLNELEWIEGKIWANVYTTNYIVIINPANGVVEGVVDLTGILPETEYDSKTDVLNGIAYDKATKRIFVTGKNWSKLFEIKLIAQ